MLQYINFYGHPRPQSGQIDRLVQRLLETPSEGQQIVAHRDGQMAGFATLYFTFSTLRASRVAILNDLYVVPAHRRHNVGSGLFEACIALVRATDCAHMEWVTAPDNQAARALYEKHGAQGGDWISYHI